MLVALKLEISNFALLFGQFGCFGFNFNKSFSIFEPFYSISLINNSISFKLQPADKKKFPYGGMNSNRPVTPPRGGNQKKGKK